MSGWRHAEEADVEPPYGTVCSVCLSTRREIGAVLEGDHIIYVDGEGNPLEPSWVLRTLRGTDDIPGPDPNEHPWMLARTNR